MAGLAHFGIAFMAKRIAPKINVWLLILGADLIDIISVLSFLPNSYLPWTHGLFMTGIWALFAGLITFFISHDRRSAFFIGFLVLTHWVVDYITWPMAGMPFSQLGIPLFFDGSYVPGLGLYSNVIISYIVDFGTLFLGIFIYLLTIKKIKKLNILTK